MKIVVPGASGFIGKNFILNAPKDWEITAIYNKTELDDFIYEHGLDNVTPYKCDLSNQNEVSKMYKSIENEFDVCLFLAANTSVPLSVNEPLTDLEMNTVSLLNFLKYFKANKIVFLSSGAVYDGLSGRVDPSMPLNPKIPYAISKLASENYIKFIANKEEKIKNYIILRFFGAYGPYEPSRKIYTKLIQNFYFKKNDSFTVYGDGKNIIDAMYIDDATEALIKVVTHDIANCTIDFCSENPMTIDELVYASAKVFGIKNVCINHVGEIEEYIEFNVSSAAMNNLFEFKPSTKLEDGLEKLAKHLRADEG